MVSPGSTRRSLDRRRRRMAVAVGAGVVVLVACVIAAGIALLRGDDDGARSAAPTTTPTTTAALPPAAAPAAATPTTVGRTYAVGTRTLTFVDSSRTTSPNGSFGGAPTRTLPTELWYPAVGASGGAPTPDAQPDAADG